MKTQIIKTSWVITEYYERDTNLSGVATKLAEPRLVKVSRYEAKLLDHNNKVLVETEYTYSTEEEALARLHKMLKERTDKVVEITSCPEYR